MRKLLLLLLLLLLSGCVQENSIERGMHYLNSVYQDGLYDDQYLEFIYRDESLACPLENCKLTYRLMDAYFNLFFIKEEFADYSLMKDQIAYGDKVLQSVLPYWEKGDIYNTINGTTGGYALDTYCILGYVYKDSLMLPSVKKNLINDNWMKDDYYVQDDWRNIADESWCTRFLIQQGENASGVIRKQVQDMYTFLEGNHTEMNKAVAVIHILYVLHDAKMYDKDFTYFQDYVAAKSELVNEDMLYQANILDVLSKTQYNDKAFLKKIAERLKKGQQSDGGWYLKPGVKNGQVFTTFRAVIALNAY